MKYGYKFSDWGLFSIQELEEVSELTEDYVSKDCFGTHIFNKDEYVWVKAVKNIFIVPHWDGKYYQYDYVNTGPYRKCDIFDTREAAEAYGREHSQCPLR